VSSLRAKRARFRESAQATVSRTVSHLSPADQLVSADTGGLQWIEDGSHKPLTTGQEWLNHAGSGSTSGVGFEPTSDLDDHCWFSRSAGFCSTKRLERVGAPNRALDGRSGAARATTTAARGPGVRRHPTGDHWESAVPRAMATWRSRELPRPRHVRRRLGWPTGWCGSRRKTRRSRTSSTDAADDGHRPRLAACCLSCQNLLRPSCVQKAPYLQALVVAPRPVQPRRYGSMKRLWNPSAKAGVTALFPR
jgi:hypothetical protein